MTARRRITFSVECSAAAEALGGFERLDPALDPVWDGLNRNPYGFDALQTDWTHLARFVVTKPVGALPALIWLFTIAEGGDVEIIHVEEFEGY